MRSISSMALIRSAISIVDRRKRQPSESSWLPASFEDDDPRFFASLVMIFRLLLIQNMNTSVGFAFGPTRTPLAVYDDQIGLGLLVVVEFSVLSSPIPFEIVWFGVLHALDFFLSWSPRSRGQYWGSVFLGPMDLFRRGHA